MPPVRQLRPLSLSGDFAQQGRLSGDRPRKMHRLFHLHEEMLHRRPRNAQAHSERTQAAQRRLTIKRLAVSV